MAIAKAMPPSILWERSKAPASIQTVEIRGISTLMMEVLDIVNLALKDRRSTLN
jgi:hypothetical protein